MNLEISDISKHLSDILKPKTKSLIITVYGDAVAHHGGEAWLGSMIELLKLFGLNERVVRTSVFRLAKENWLAAHSVGRKSYYRLTDVGRRRFTAAHGRVYKSQARAWDRNWTIVFLGVASLETKLKKTIKRDLEWMGFGQLSNGDYLHPDPDENSIRELFSDLDVEPFIVRGQPYAWIREETLNKVFRQCWDVERLEADYEDFLLTFRPVWTALSNSESLSPELCFVVRTLLMHGYRKAILRDPMLPEELLPSNWPGKAARTLSRNLYRLVERQAETHVMSVLETPEGPIPNAHPGYFLRFGGLRDI